MRWEIAVHGKVLGKVKEKFAKKNEENDTVQAAYIAFLVDIT